VCKNWRRERAIVEPAWWSSAMKNQAEHVNGNEGQGRKTRFTSIAFCPVFPVLPVVCFPFTCSFERRLRSALWPPEDTASVLPAEDFGIARAHLWRPRDSELRTDCARHPSGPDSVQTLRRQSQTTTLTESKLFSFQVSFSYRFIAQTEVCATKVSSS
jgi:hypothetical protein